MTEEELFRFMVWGNPVWYTGCWGVHSYQVDMIVNRGGKILTVINDQEYSPGELYKTEEDARNGLLRKHED